MNRAFRRLRLLALLGGLVAMVAFLRPHSEAPGARDDGSVSAVARGVRDGGRPVIFVGLDGGDWQLLDSYMAKGAMPNLALLVAEGTGGVLESLHPPLSPVVWTTMMTGVSPIEHRVLDFTRFSPSTREKEPITSDERQVPALWNMATYAGRTSATFGLWATYPAETVRGLLVSDRLLGFLFTEKDPPPGTVFPAARESWARETLRTVDAETGLGALKAYLPWLDEAEYRRLDGERGPDPYRHPVTALRRILVETEVYHRLATEWIAKEKPDLAIVYFQGTDSIGHAFAPFAPPRQAAVTEVNFEKYQSVPERYFHHMDELLGAYRRLAEERGAVLVLASDHGFFWNEGRPTELSSFAMATAARWHRKDGLYLVWGSGVSPSPGHTHRGGVAQLAGSLLSLLGLPRGLGLAEPVLPGIPAASGPAISYAEHYQPAQAVQAKGGRSDPEAIEKLKALGYIGANEAPSAPQGLKGTRTAGSYNNEGLVLRAEGRAEASLAAFEHALELDPGLGSALWNLSDALSQLHKDPDRSDDLLVKAFASRAPDTQRFLVERAMEYQKGGSPTRSMKLLDAALAARSDEPEAWLFRGRYRVESGDCRGALADFKRATTIAPTRAAGFASEGLAYLCLGDRASARRSLVRSLELDPNQPQVRQFLRRP